MTKAQALHSSVGFPSRMEGVTKRRYRFKVNREEHMVIADSFSKAVLWAKYVSLEEGGRGHFEMIGEWPE